MKEVLLIVALILVASSQAAMMQSSRFGPGCALDNGRQCIQCKDGYMMSQNGNCTAMSEGSSGGAQQFKIASNESNTQVVFSKSAADAQKNGDIRPEMRSNWPPQSNNPGQARLLQQIDWNQAVQWVYSSSTVVNYGWVTYFKVYFVNDCPQQAYVTLRIQATGSMWVFANGVYYYFGDGSMTEITFPVNCGPNTIEVYVYNYCCYQGGIKFEILQNECYDCANTASGFFNRETCRCECSNICQCNNPMFWSDYPNCYCQCSNTQFCYPPKYWHARKCKCECPPVSCPPGYGQNLSTCACEKKPCSPPNGGCGWGYYWYKCKCCILKTTC